MDDITDEDFFDANEDFAGVHHNYTDFKEYNIPPEPKPIRETINDHKNYHIPRMIEHYNNPHNIDNEVSYFV